MTGVNANELTDRQVILMNYETLSFQKATKTEHCM